MSIDSQRNTALLHGGLAFFAYSAWATTWPVGKLALDTWTPIGLTAFRFIIAGTLLLCISLAKHSRPKMPTYRELLVGSLQFCLYYLLAYKALRVGLASTTAVVAGAYPVLVLLIRPGSSFRSKKAMLAPALTIAGCAVIGIGRLDSGTTAEGLGIAALAALAMALGTLAPRPKGDASLSEVSRFIGTAMLIGAGATLIAGFLLGDPLLRKCVDARAWMSLFWLSVVGSGIVFVMIEWLLRRHEPWKISMGYTVVPALSAIMGWYFLGEHVGFVAGLGMLATLVGIGLSYIVSEK